MRILVIGGTMFFGRALVEAALAGGHDVTLFNRGLSCPEAFPAVPTIRGDRQTDLDKLPAENWDAVVDTCGYFPEQVALSAHALARHTAVYAFVSTMSVYAHPELGVDESGELLPPESGVSGEITAQNYGGLKVACEGEIGKVFGTNVFIMRCGLLVGPHDTTDRFTYWVERTGRGGAMLAPAPPETPVQFIDARDAAKWAIAALAARTQGVFNVTGNPVAWGEVLKTCTHVINPGIRIEWVDEDFLLARGVRPFSDLPLWLPSRLAGAYAIDCTKARDAGLRFRPIAKTVRETYTWLRHDRGWKTRRAGMPSEREFDLLQEWERRNWRIG